MQAIRAAVLLLCLSGCALPDQRLFLHAGQAPGPAEAARARLAAGPYVVIPLPNADPGWPRQVAEALENARARRPDAVFVLLAPVPLNAGQGVVDKAVAQGAADTQMVAEAVGREGTPPAWLQLGLQGDPGTPGREVRIFLR